MMGPAGTGMRSRSSGTSGTRGNREGATVKYIVLELILVLAVIGKPAGIAGQPMTYDGVARVEQQRAPGVTTLVTIHLQVRNGTATLTLSIRQSEQSCGQGATCGVEPLFAGSATRQIAIGDASVQRQLAEASLHARLAVFDTVLQTSEEITVDLQWTATGTLVRTPDDSIQAFSRDATASGLINSSSLGAVRFTSTSYGSLSRHLEG